MRLNILNIFNILSIIKKTLIELQDKFGRKKLMIACAVIALAITCLIILLVNIGGSDEDVDYEIRKASEVNMVQTLTAAGEVKAAESETISFDTSKTYTAMCAEENETVSKGQHLIKYSDGTYTDAPADGLISEINAPDTGETPDSENILTFEYTSDLSLEITVPEDEINEISKGDKAAIVVNSDLSKEFTGTISSKKEMSTTLISEKASEATDSDSSSQSDSSSSGNVGSGSSGSSSGSSENSSGSSSGGNSSAGMGASGSSDPFGSESSTAYYTVSMKFKNDGTILPGMSASCTITISDRTAVLSVPVESVYFDKKDRTYVYTGTVSSPDKTFVTTGDSDAQNVEIKKGLKKGDSIRVEKQK